MSKPIPHNAFKEIIPKASLTEKDKSNVLKTIATAKLFMEAFDLLSVKHFETRIEMIKTLGGENDITEKP
jgi:hypothetical protein